MHLFGVVDPIDQSYISFNYDKIKTPYIFNRWSILEGETNQQEKQR